MNILFSSAQQRTVFVLPLLFFMGQLFAQTCSVTGPSMACVGGMSTYHVSVNVSVPYNVIWKLVPANSGNPIMSNNEMTMVHWNTAGTVQVIAEIRSTGTPSSLLTSCSVVPAVSVETFPNPEIVPIPAPDLGACLQQNNNLQQRATAYCAGSTVQFFPNGSGGTYEWEVTGSGVGTYQVNLDHSVTVVTGPSGTVKVRLEETNAAGCSRETEVEYRVYEPPVSSFTEISHGTLNPIRVCKGEDLLFFGQYDDPNDLPMGGWFWSVTPVSSNQIVGTGSEQQFAYTFNQPGNYKVSLYTTNCLGCASPVTSIEVIVMPEAGPEIVCPSVVCQSSTPVQYCTPSVCANYTWTINGGTPPSSTAGNCVDVTWNNPLPNGYGFVTLQVANCQPPGVCMEPVTVEVPVIPTVQAVSGPNGLCNPNAQNVRYSVPYWPGAMYTWSVVIDQNQSGGTVIPIGSGNDCVVNLTNFYGKFRVKVTIDHPVARCASTGELAVSVQNYQITGDGACFGSDVNLSITPAPTFSAYQVHWRVVETNAAPIVVNNVPSVSIPFTAFGGSGTFTVKAVITPGSGQPAFECDELTRFVTIAAEVPPVTAIQGPRKICVPKEYTYTGVPGQPGTLTWSVVGGSFSQGNTGASVKVNWTETAPPYQLSVFRTVNGCNSAPYEVSDFTNITGQTPTISGPAMPCEGGISTYTTDIDGADSYTWSIVPGTDGSIIGGAGTDEIQVLWHNFGPATVRLVTKICGTNSTVNLPIQVIQNTVSINCPVPNLPDGCQLCAGTEYTFTTTNNTGAYYKWFLDGSLVPALEGATATAFPVTFSSESAGTHFVRVEMTGPSACPGTFGDVLSVEVVANPKPVIFPSNILDCANLAPLTLNATTWPGAILEIFTWSPNSPPTYTPNGSQLIINSSNQNDYLQLFKVGVERFLENGLTCRAQADYIPTCAGGELIPNNNPFVIFSDWNFNLGVAELDCQPNGANECGYIRVSGSLNGKDFSDVDFAEWRVADPFQTVNPNPVPILGNSGLQSTELSVFSRAGFYPSVLRVRFTGDVNTYSDLRILEIPLVPDIVPTYACGGTPGTYTLTLTDASETVPNAIIHQRQWAVRINGGATQIINDNLPQITLQVPVGATVDASLTPYTHTVGQDKPDMLYYCTRCTSFTLPPAPMVEIVADRTTVCSNTPVQFSATITPPNEPIINYKWAFGDGAMDNTPAPQRTYVGGGTYTVTLTVTTQRGCELVATKEIEVLGISPLGGTISTMYDACQSSAALMYVLDPGTNIPTNLFMEPRGRNHRCHYGKQYRHLCFDCFRCDNGVYPQAAASTNQYPNPLARRHPR